MMATNHNFLLEIARGAVESRVALGLGMRAMNRKTPLIASRRDILFAGLAFPLLSACGSGPETSGAGPRVIVAEGVASPLRAEIDSLFTDSAMGQTRALLIQHDGRTVFEGYGEGFSPESRLISWSMAKTVTAVMLGMLISDGRLALNDPAPIPAWQRPGDTRGSITLRHLLHMSSGLEHAEDADPIWESDTVAMLFGAGAGDMAAMAEAKPPVAVPGEQFIYSTATTVILSDIIARALTNSRLPAVRRDSVRNFLDGRLAGPLDMPSLIAEFDAAGTMIGGSIMHATARDYAKFGEFLRRGGLTADGTALVPKSWIDFMLTPSRANPAYGGHIWLNQGDGGENAPLWPGRGPKDIFACIGHQGQFILVSPRQKLTIVRLGNSTRPQIGTVRDKLKDIVTAF